MYRRLGLYEPKELLLDKNNPNMSFLLFGVAVVKINYIYSSSCNMIVLCIYK